MINHNFNTNLAAREMTNSWRGYYARSLTISTKALYRFTYEFTKSRTKSFLCAFLFSVASLIFAKVKHHKVHHRILFTNITAVCSMLLLGTFLRKSHQIGNLIYSWSLQDRVAHGYMTPLRDEALMHVESAIFGGDMVLYRAHAIAFSEAAVLLDPYEYHEAELADWHKVREKLEESFVELKRVFNRQDI